MAGIDPTHQHFVSQIIQDANPHTPINPSGGQIAATDKQIVFMDGTDAVGSADLTWDAGLTTLGLASGEGGGGTIATTGLGAQLHIQAGDGDASHVGGEVVITSGGSAGQSSGALEISTGTDGDGGDSGDISIVTGRAAAGKSGDISFRAGPSGTSGEGGNINIVAGTGQDSNGGDVIIQAGAKVTGGSHGSVQILEGSSTYSIEMNASGLFVFGGVVILDSLPTADPGNVGQIYSDGVPSAGVPKILKISGG